MCSARSCCYQKGENGKCNYLKNAVGKRGGTARLGAMWAMWAVAHFCSCLCNAHLPHLHGCCWGSVLEDPLLSPPQFLLTPSSSSPAAQRRPGPSTAPDALVQDPTAPYVPSPPLQCWHSQTSQVRTVVSSSFHLGLSVLYIQTLVSQGHKYYQHSLTLSFLKTPKEDKPTNFASSCALRKTRVPSWKSQRVLRLMHGVLVTQR